MVVTASIVVVCRWSEQVWTAPLNRPTPRTSRLVQECDRPPNASTASTFVITVLSHLVVLVNSTSIYRRLSGMAVYAGGVYCRQGCGLVPLLHRPSVCSSRVATNRLVRSLASISFQLIRFQIARCRGGWWRVAAVAISTSGSKDARS